MTARQLWTACLLRESPPCDLTARGAAGFDHRQTSLTDLDLQACRRDFMSEVRLVTRGTDSGAQSCECGKPSSAQTLCRRCGGGMSQTHVDVCTVTLHVVRCQALDSVRACSSAPVQGTHMHARHMYRHAALVLVRRRLRARGQVETCRVRTDQLRCAARQAGTPLADRRTRTPTVRSRVSASVLDHCTRCLLCPSPPTVNHWRAPPVCRAATVCRAYMPSPRCYPIPIPSYRGRPPVPDGLVHG